MKRLLSLVMVMIVMIVSAQEKEERIKRDVEVAENVLSTLIRQQIDRKAGFWGFEVKGTYTPGYGVTLRIPSDNWGWPGGFNYAPVVVNVDEDGSSVTVKSRSNDGQNQKEKIALKKVAERDSARTQFSEKILEASKTFLADYGDLMGLEPNEKIMITTKSDRNRGYTMSYSGDFKMPKRMMMSVEGVKGDLTSYKQGKITRDQLISKFKVVNSEVSNDRQSDLELLSTIISRLYRSDLSKTYYLEGSMDYERLKDFGVTYYMRVYSSNENGYQRWNMPTQDLEDLSQEERDKKVKELYPSFEKDIKDNFIEYGRTINSLKDEELLIFDITMTKCKGCGIPSSLELSVKASVLKEFGAGKINKDAAVSKINVKKGSPQ